MTDARDDTDTPDWIELTMVADHDGVQRKHTLRARPGMIDWKDTVALARLAINREDPGVLVTMSRVMRRAMADDDGTPARWVPSIRDEVFAAPDGRELPVSELPALLAFDAGSSARRWRGLMDDEAVFIDPESFISEFNRLMEAPARPTKR